MPKRKSSITDDEKEQAVEEFQKYFKYYPNAFNGKDDKRHLKWYDEIMENVKLEQIEIFVFKPVLEPRLTALFGDEPKTYKYSKTERKMQEMPDCIKEIRDAIFDLTDVYYDFVLVNYYRDGSDHVSWHADSGNFLNTFLSF
jgi:alkylated DNA repair dioxygenase AlkB